METVNRVVAEIAMALENLQFHCEANDLDIVSVQAGSGDTVTVKLTNGQTFYVTVIEA